MLACHVELVVFNQWFDKNMTYLTIISKSLNPNMTSLLSEFTQHDMTHLTCLIIQLCWVDLDTIHINLLNKTSFSWLTNTAHFQTALYMYTYKYRILYILTCILTSHKFVHKYIIIFEFNLFNIIFWQKVYLI